MDGQSTRTMFRSQSGNTMIFEMSCYIRMVSSLKVIESLFLSLRAAMLDRVHYAHIGVNGCLRRAKECIYWPGMDAGIREYVSRCSTCRSFDVKQPKESLISHTFPLRPWAKVGTDFFHFQDYEYLMTVDYYSFLLKSIA